MSTEYRKIWSFPGRLTISHVMPKGATVELVSGDTKYLIGRKKAAEVIWELRKAMAKWEAGR